MTNSRTLFLALLTAATVTSTPMQALNITQWWQTSSTLNKVLVTGATLTGAGFAGKWIYTWANERFFTPSDYEVLENASVMCSTAQESHQVFISNFSHELSLIKENTEREAIEKYLVDRIKNNGGRRPFLTYARTVSNDYCTLEWQQVKLGKQKMHLLKRRIKVMSNEELSEKDKQEFVTQYTALEKQITEICLALQDAMLSARKIKNYARGLADYKHEYALQRIEELERQAERDRQDRWSDDRVCKPTAYVYTTEVKVETPTPTTHVHINTIEVKVEAPKTQPATQTVSTPQPQATVPTVEIPLVETNNSPTASSDSWESYKEDRYEADIVHSNWG